MQKEPDKNRDESELLEKVIKMSQDDTRNIPERPSDETILAYLSGTADDSRKEEMLEALAVSPAFRREFRDLARGLSALENDEIKAAFNETAAPEPPSLDEFLASGGEKTIARLSLWDKIWHTLIPRRTDDRQEPARGYRIRLAGSFLAAAAVLVIVIAGIDMINDRPVADIPDAGWSYAGELDAGLFVANIPRTAGAPDDSVVLAQSHRQAAENMYRQIISLENGVYVYDNTAGLSATADRTHPLLLTLVDQENRLIANISAAVPEKATASDEPIQVWIMTVPSRELYSLTMPADSMQSSWTDDRGERYFVVFTCITDGGYFAVPGVNINQEQTI